MWQQRIKLAIDAQKEKGRYRQRIECQHEGSTIQIKVDGKQYLNFSSNDYLGLAHHPRMMKAAEVMAKKYGVGSGGSPHVTGYSQPLQKLESTLANWLGYEAAIVYPSGFTANQAVIKLLIERGDHMIADRLSHASLLEAAMFSEGRLFRFKHNDVASLESYLQKVAPTDSRVKDTANEIQSHDLENDLVAPNQLNLVITEGIFSMDGDSAPLEEIAKVAHHYNALLMVDDAHGIGILGEDGKGTCNHYGIHPDILVVTFGKAFGCSGAAVLMSQELADYCVQFSRPLIYSTAIAPMQAGILLEALDIIRGDEGMLRRIQLQRNILYFKSAFQKCRDQIKSRLAILLANQSTASQSALITAEQTMRGDTIEAFENDALIAEKVEMIQQKLPYLLPSESAIQPLIIGKDSDALQLSAQLKNAGIWVSAIRPPTVPLDTARLRITLTADHTKEMIDQFINALQDAIVDLAQRDLIVDVLDTSHTSHQ